MTSLQPVACLVLLAAIVVIALLAGRIAATVSALAGYVALNWFFTPPVHTLRIADPTDAVALVVFVAMALGVATYADRARRTGPTVVEAEVLRAADLVIDLAGHRVTKAGAEVRLTPTEWSFLELLARNPGRLVPRDRILAEVWGPAYGKETHYLRVYMSQLRGKLEDDPAHPRLLITTAGVGYTLVP